MIRAMKLCGFPMIEDCRTPGMPYGKPQAWWPPPIL